MGDAVDFVTNEGSAGSIEIREGTDSWGPYEVDFGLGLPSDQILASVELKGYAGKANKKTDLSGLTEITELLIESTGSTIDGTKFAFTLQHPGQDYRGTSASLVFIITTSSGGKFPFFFYPVKIY